MVQTEKGNTRLPIILQARKSKMICKNLPLRLIANIWKCYWTQGVLIQEQDTVVISFIYLQQVRRTSKALDTIWLITYDFVFAVAKLI